VLVAELKIVGAMIVSGNMLVQLEIQHVQLLVLWQAVVFLKSGPGKSFLAQKC